MNTTLLALLEAALLVGGAAGARRFTRWIARGGPGESRGGPGPASPSPPGGAEAAAHRRVVLMAAVAAWVILFGLLPFFAFALLVQRGTASGSPPAAWEGFVLNLIPFALLAAPLVGFFEGARALSPARRRSRAPRGPS